MPTETLPPVYARRNNGPIHILPVTETAPAWLSLCGVRVLRFSNTRKLPERPTDNLCPACLRHEAAGTRGA